jgi:hypothetical protein
MVDDAVESPGPSRQWRQNIGGEPLYEDSLAGQYGLAPEAARNDNQLNASSRQRQVADPAMVPTCARAAKRYRRMDMPNIPSSHEP